MPYFFGQLPIPRVTVAFAKLICEIDNFIGLCVKHIESILDFCRFRVIDFAGLYVGLGLIFIGFLAGDADIAPAELESLFDESDVQVIGLPEELPLKNAPLLFAGVAIVLLGKLDDQLLAEAVLNFPESLLTDHVHEGVDLLVLVELEVAELALGLAGDVLFVAAQNDPAEGQEQHTEAGHCQLLGEVGDGGESQVQQPHIHLLRERVDHHVQQKHNHCQELQAGFKALHCLADLYLLLRQSGFALLERVQHCDLFESAVDV